MAKKNIIDVVEGNKAWGWVAGGLAILALVGVAIAAKETIDATRAAKNSQSAKEDLQEAKEEAGVVEETGITEEGEETSGCDGCSNASGDWLHGKSGWQI